LGVYDSPSVTETAGPITPSDRLQNVGKVIYPLFCVAVYEHAWMSAGFGVWGKEDWLKEFWTVLNWEKVSKAFEYAQNKADRWSV
jgi:superoxide dismutase, Fe-Mn family